MKVVLFCGGLGTRIREYSENIPKPMIPLGHQPILHHVMEYYSDYGHNDFVLCLGYKANVVKDFFLTIRPQTFADCVVSDGGRNVQLLEEVDRDWSVTLLDTGIWRNIGERLWSARSHVMNEDIFLANYSDGLSDVDLDNMTQRFRASGKVACFLAVRPPLTYHIWPILPRAAMCARFVPPIRPISGSMAAISSSSRKSSTICAKARNWCWNRSAA